MANMENPLRGGGWFTSAMQKSPKYQDYYDYVKPTLNGGYAYMGPVYSFGKDNDISYARYITVMLICSFLMLAAGIGSGLLYIAGMNTAWQVAPYGLEVLFNFMTVWSVVRLAFTKQPMKIFSMRPTAEAIPKRSRPAMLAAAVGLTCIALYVFLNGWDDKPPINTIIYMLARLVVALSAGLIYKLATTNVWDEKNIDEGETEEEQAEEPASEEK